MESLFEGWFILPIVGASGVGKSHVIRWIDAHLKRRPDASRFHIIRVPKASSLKGVLRLLLRDLEGPEFDRLKESVNMARDHLDPGLAARHLQTSLRHRLEREADAARLRITSGGERAGDREMREFGDARMLPALLGDPLLEQQHWLSRSGNRRGVLALMADQVTQEGSQDGDGRKHEFAAEDFVLDDSIDVNELSKQARDCYRALFRADSARRRRAAEILNSVLDDAKNDLLQLGDNSLVELFGGVRAELHRRNLELVFLVEDFAVLSGLQGALLQVMIAEATRDGQQTLCTMRTALAYTEGYMAGRDTVLTRARSEWLLEERSGDDADILQRVERIVGAYLNAARVGQARLRQAYIVSGGSDLRSWVPTADTDDLEPPARSVVEAFGRSADGYPLFPFNVAAVHQLTRRGSIDSRGQLLFNPRHIINNLLTRVLMERPVFLRGEFPPAHVADDVRSADVTNEVGRRVPAAALKRYLGVLRLWGNQPDSTAAAANMAPEIYTGFGLQPIDFGLQPAVSSTSSDPVPEVRTAGATIRPSVLSNAPQLSAGEHPDVRRWRQLLEAWSDGAVLEQSDARLLRSWIAEAVYSSLPLDALLLRLRSKPLQLQKQVFLPRSRGQGNVSPADAFVTVAHETDLGDPLHRARLVHTLLAFVRRYAVYQGWNYDGAEVDGGLVRDFINARAVAAAEYLRARHFQIDADTKEPLVRALLVGARGLGVKGANDRASLPDLMAALFAESPPPTAGPAGPWAGLQASLRSSRSGWCEMLLEQVGARQGGAAVVHAVDAAALVPLIERAKTDWLLCTAPPSSNNDSDYQDFVRGFSDLRTSIEKAIRDEKLALVEWLPEATAWFGDDFDKAAVQEKLRDLVTDVKNRGLVPNADFDNLRKELSDLNSIALKTARDAATVLAGEPKRGEVLSTLAELPGRAVPPAKRFMDRMNMFLGQVETTLTAHETAIGSDVVVEAIRVVESELDGLGELFRICKEAKQ
jgi:hypothetical protein